MLPIKIILKNVFFSTFVSPFCLYRDGYNAESLTNTNDLNVPTASKGEIPCPCGQVDDTDNV